MDTIDNRNRSGAQEFNSASIVESEIGSRIAFPAIRFGEPNSPVERAACDVNSVEIDAVEVFEASDTARELGQLGSIQSGRMFVGLSPDRLERLRNRVKSIRQEPIKIEAVVDDFEQLLELRIDGERVVREARPRSGTDLTTSAAYKKAGGTTGE